MRPIFLIGSERSGTTLLRLMLDGHPRVSWLGEFEYAVDFTNDPEHWPDTRDYLQFLATDRIFNNSNLDIDATLDYPALIKSFLIQKQRRDGKQFIGATCHRHYDRLLKLFPDARFIYLLRDPRDVARSTIGMGWAGNVWKGVDRWIEAEELWGKMKKTIRASSYVEVRYEDLIAAPEATLSTVCNFLNIEYDNQMMSYPAYTTYSIPDPTLVEQWKRKLTKKQVQLVESRAGSFMNERKYVIISDSLVEPSAVEKLFLSIQDRLFRARFNVRRYGLSLVGSAFIARKLRLSKIERKIRHHFHKIDNSLLK